MPLTDEDRAEILAMFQGTQQATPTAEEIDAAGEQSVAVIEAQADAQVAVIEASAQADIDRMEAAAEVTAEIEERQAEDAPPADADGEDVADDIDVSDGDSLGSDPAHPEADHWFFKSRGRRK